MKDMDDILNAAQSLQSRLRYMDATLSLIGHGGVDHSATGGPDAAIMLKCVRDVCEGLRVMLHEAGGDVGSILDEVKRS